MASESRLIRGRPASKGGTRSRRSCTSRWGPGTCPKRPRQDKSSPGAPTARKGATAAISSRQSKACPSEVSLRGRPSIRRTSCVPPVPPPLVRPDPAGPYFQRPLGGPRSIPSPAIRRSPGDARGSPSSSWTASPSECSATSGAALLPRGMGGRSRVPEVAPFGASCKGRNQACRTSGRPSRYPNLTTLKSSNSG